MKKIKEIIPNRKIREIFGMKENDVMNFENLQTWLKKCIRNTPLMKMFLSCNESSKYNIIFQGIIIL